MKTGKIIVQRVRRLGESKYSVGIYIDDKFIVNTIKDNRQEIEVEPGKHILKVEQGNRSGEIEINVDGKNDIEYSFSSTRLIYFSFIFLLLSLTLAFLFDISEQAIFLMNMPGIFISIYTLTKGKKQYFVFESIEQQPYKEVGGNLHW